MAECSSVWCNSNATGTRSVCVTILWSVSLSNRVRTANIHLRCIIKCTELLKCFYLCCQMQRNGAEEKVVTFTQQQKLLSVLYLSDCHITKLTPIYFKSSQMHFSWCPAVQTELNFIICILLECFYFGKLLLLLYYIPKLNIAFFFNATACHKNMLLLVILNRNTCYLLRDATL